MIRVLQVLGTVGMGGAESRVMDLYRHMDRRRIQFDFLVTEGTDDHYRGEIESLGGRVYNLPVFRMVNILQYRQACKDFFSSHMAADSDPLRSKSLVSEYAVVHGHMTSTAPIYLPIARDFGVPLTIAHARSAGVDPGLKGAATKFMRRDLYKKCDMMIACSDEAGDAVFGKGRDYVFMPNAIDASSFAYDEEARLKIRKEYGIEDDTFVIGHVGSFRFAKNHEFILRLFARMLKEYAGSDKSEPARGLKLMLVGDGDLRSETEELVSRLGLTKDVIFTGNRNPVSPYYQAFDMLLFPSRYEGMPGTVVEAQASGLPCVISSAITGQVVITDRVKVLSLDDPEDAWIGCITELIGKWSASDVCERRKDVKTTDGKAIEDTVYDVNNQVEYYTELYTSAWNRA